MLNSFYKSIPVYLLLSAILSFSFAQEVTNPQFEKNFSAEKKQILKDLDQARLNNDVKKKELLEARLNKIDNTVSVFSPSDNSIQSVIVNKELGNEFDYNYSMIANLPHFGQAVATVPSGTLAGRIYVAVGQYAANPYPDTAKIFYSTNNGLSWVYYSYWFMPGANMDFRANEMDITILYDGTTAWLFGVSSIDWISNNNKRVIFWRYNLTTNDFYRTTLSWPGAPITNLDYNGRLATDNDIYVQSPFIYLSVSSDSSISGSSYHINRTKLAVVQSPFSVSPAIAYRNLGLNYTGNTPSLYVYSDVAYVYTGMNRVFVIMSIDGITVINLYYTEDFGVSYSGYYGLYGNYPLRGSSLASVVNENNPKLMIVNRAYTENWDIIYYYSSNGGTNAASWTNGYVEHSIYKSAGYPNVTWVKGSLTDFKTAFTLDSGGITRAYYAGWNGSFWYSPSRMPVGNLQADTTFNSPVAGYRIGGGDNCLTIWNNFYPIYASHNCLTTVGTSGNNNIPETYNLHQNYPNPFNPSTSIKFDIPGQSFVKITVYDITGKEIESLVNDVKEPGTYEVLWDGSKHASGVYMYKIDAGQFSDVRKMVLIK